MGDGSRVGYARAQTGLWWGAIKLSCNTNTTYLHDTMATTVTNGGASHVPIEVCFPLPKAPQTNINLRLHDNGPNITLFLTTSTPDSASAVPLGSLVYTMPNVRAHSSNTKTA